MLRRLGWSLTTAVVLAITIPAELVVAGPPPDIGTAQDCHERFFVGPGVESELREHVPERYEFVRDESGRPLLLVAPIHCERVFFPGDEERPPMTFALFEAIVQSPEGEVCPPPTLCFDFYILFRAVDRADVARWFREGLPGYPATYVPHLTFEQGAPDPARLGAPFHFEAGPPTPSSFELDALVRERSMEGPVKVTWWWDGAAGTSKMTFNSEDLAFGESDGALHAAPGSDMATLFGTPTPQPAPGFSQLGGLYWREGYVTKEILAP